MLPQIIKDVGFDFHWSVKKVWALDIPTEKMNIEELVWHFSIPFWSKKNIYYDLKPNDVMKYPNIYKKEYERIMKSELLYPIDIMNNKGRWVILDGLHRLSKYKIKGESIICVRKIPRDKIPEISI